MSHTRVLSILLLALTVVGCTTTRVREGWQGSGRRWFDAEVLTGFDDQGAMIATLAVSIPYRNLVFFREDQGYAATYSIDAIQRRDGEPLTIARFDGRVAVDEFAQTRQALVERKTVRIDLHEIPPASERPLQLNVSVEVGGTQRRASTVLTITPERLNEGGLALGEITLYRLRNPLEVPPETRIEVAARAVPDATLFDRTDSGFFDLATGTPWALIRVFDLSGNYDGEHQLTLEVRDNERGGHAWSDRLSVPKVGVETSVLLQLPAEAFRFGGNRLSVSFQQEGRRSIDIQDYGLNITDDRAWSATRRQIELLASDREKEQLENASPAERAQVWEQFWDRRDADDGPGNPRLREHYRRVAQARRQYVDGMRDGALSDRGRTYVLLGDPDSIAVAQDTSDALAQWEIWTYEDAGYIYYFHIVHGAHYRLVRLEQV